MKENRNILDGLLNVCVFTVSFFLYSGFYAALAMAISFAGEGATRFLSVPIRLLTTVLMLIVIVATIFFRSQPKSQKKKFFYFIFLCFWLLYFLKLFYHHSEAFALHSVWYEYILYSVNFSILPFIMFSEISFDKYKKTVFDAIVFSGFVMGLISVYLYKDILASGVSRINLAKYLIPGQETLSPLALSYASIMTIMLCIYQLLHNRKKSTLYLLYTYVTIGLSLIMFLLGASRGSILAFLFSLCYLILQSDLKTKLRIALIIALGTPILIWSVAATGSGVFSRAANSVESGSTGRETLWIDAWSEFVQYPVLGGRIEIGFHPHNIFLEVLMSMGIIGFFLLMFMFLNSFKKIFVLPKMDKNYIWIFIILLQGICQHNFSGSVITAVLIFFPIGFILSKSQTL